MTTIYNILRNTCGLSQSEAANFHGVRLDTVQNWCQGKSKAPDGVINELRGLWNVINVSAKQGVELYLDLRKKHGEPEDIELFLAKTNKEAQERGFPCVGAQHASVGLVAAAVSCKIVLK